jgi:hypothetical protein
MTAPPNKPICTLRYVQLAPGQPESILLLGAYSSALLQQGADGHWRAAGMFAGARCASTGDALAKGSFTTAPHPLPDIVAGGEQLTVSPLNAACPTVKSGQPAQAPAKVSLAEAPRD